MKMIPVLRSILLWAAVACFLYYSGSLDELDKKIRIAMSASAGAGIVVIVVFLWNLFFAPVWIDKEQEEQISTLDKQIADAKITEEKIAGLMKYRKRFIDEIFAAGVISDYDFPIKSQLFKDIHAEAIKYMETCRYSEKYTGLLRTLGTIDQFTTPKGQLINMAKKAGEVIKEISDGQ